MTNLRCNAHSLTVCLLQMALRSNKYPMTCFSGDSHVVAQQGQTRYEVCPHARAGSALACAYPWCAFTAPHPHGCAWQSWGHGPSHCLGSVHPSLGMVGQGHLGMSLPQPALCQSAPSPNIAKGSSLTTWFAMPLQVLCGLQSVIRYQKQTLVGSAICGSSTPRVREGGCCGSRLSAQVHTYAKRSGMHLVLTWLAIQVNVIGKVCLYGHPHKHQQHSHKHLQHSQPDPIRRSGREACSSHIHRSLAAGPGLCLCSSWSPPSVIPTVTTPRPMASCDPWTLTSHPTCCTVLLQGCWWSHT